MTRQEQHVVAERPKLAGDRFDQQIVIAARQVGAANGAPEQYVADDGKPRGFVEIDDVSRRVARTVEDVEGQVADSDRVAAFQPAVRREGARIVEAWFFFGIGQLVDPELIVLMRPLDGQALLLGKVRGHARMVAVRVGDEDLLQRDPGALDGGHDTVEMPARIDHRALHGLGTPEYRRVLLERRHGHDGGLERFFEHDWESGL